MEKNSMDTYPKGHPNITIEKIGGRDKRRQELETAVKATSQPGAFQSLDEHFFGTEYKAGTKKMQLPNIFGDI